MQTPGPCPASCTAASPKLNPAGFGLSPEAPPRAAVAGGSRAGYSCPSAGAGTGRESEQAFLLEKHGFWAACLQQRRSRCPGRAAAALQPTWSGDGAGSHSDGPACPARQVLGRRPESGSNAGASPSSGAGVDLLCIARLAVTPRQSHTSARLGMHSMPKGVGGPGELAGSTSAIPAVPRPCGEAGWGATTGNTSAVGGQGTVGAVAGDGSLFSTLTWGPRQEQALLGVGLPPGCTE